MLLSFGDSAPGHSCWGQQVSRGPPLQFPSMPLTSLGGASPQLYRSRAWWLFVKHRMNGHQPLGHHACCQALVTLCSLATSLLFGT
jgi:hypothetical protein